MTMFHGPGEYNEVLVEKHQQHLGPCPICGGSMLMYEYVSPSRPTLKVVMCETNEPWWVPDAEDAEDGGCPLTFPPLSMYKPTYREAAGMVLRYGDGLTMLRQENRAR